MKASIFHPVTYVPDAPICDSWPMPPHLCDERIGQRSFRQAIEMLVAADELDFDWVSVAEHHYAAGSMTPNPVVMAAAVAEHVKRARIALLGATLPLTNPVRVAEEFAMLDNLTGGRVIFGMLRGTPNEFLTYGTNSAETRTMYEEGVDLVMRALSEPQPFGWQGRHYQYRTVSVWPRLVQRDPVFMVSANSPDAASFAAKRRLMAGFAFAPVPVVARMSAIYQSQAEANGWTPGAEDRLYRGFIYVAETDEKAAEEAARTYWQLPGAPRRGPPLRGPAPGTAAAPVPPSGERAVTTEMIDPKLAISGSSFANLGLQFAGSPDTILSQLKHLKDVTGVGTVDFVFAGPALSHAMAMKSLELFGREVLPAMHDL
jgi:alkanesulfonate monooxygenase SsuD/methylene tetrahydromethanopterin reductase-like flavin-dependent oxidoreductase (luciferase family)